METVVSKKLYEGMFLVDSAQATDWDATIATLENVLNKAEAEIVSMRKWDERRLAYEINGKNRGTYILCYFKVDGEKIQEIEKSVQLSEQIMRVLILSTERMTLEDIEKDTPAGRVAKEAAAREVAAAEAAAEAEAAAAAKAEQKSPDSEATEAGEVEAKEQAVETEDAAKTEEPREAVKTEDIEKTGTVGQAEDAAEATETGETKQSAEPQEPDQGEPKDASGEAESDRPEE